MTKIVLSRRSTLKKIKLSGLLLIKIFLRTREAYEVIIIKGKQLKMVRDKSRKTKNIFFFFLKKKVMNTIEYRIV